MLLATYERGGVAHGAVHSLLDGCWLKLLRIKSPASDKESPLEKKAAKVLRDINAGEFEVEWPPVNAPSEKDKAELLGKMTSAMQQAFQAGMADLAGWSKSGTGAAGAGRGGWGGYWGAKLWRVPGLWLASFQRTVATGQKQSPEKVRFQEIRSLHSKVICFGWIIDSYLNLSNFHLRFFK